MRPTAPQDGAGHCPETWARSPPDLIGTPLQKTDILMEKALYPTPGNEECFQPDSPALALLLMSIPTTRLSVRCNPRNSCPKSGNCTTFAVYSRLCAAWQRLLVTRSNAASAGRHRVCAVIFQLAGPLPSSRQRSPDRYWDRPAFAAYGRRCSCGPPSCSRR